MSGFDGPYNLHVKCKTCPDVSLTLDDKGSAMYCGNCGKQTNDTNRYCEHCHFDLIHIQRLQNESDEDESEDEFRGATAVAKRCLVLCSVVAASHNEERTEIVAWLKGEGLWKEVSPKERAFLQSKKPTNKQLINASWRLEALYLLLWALRLIPSIEVGSTPAEPARLKVLLPFLSQTSDFVTNSELRPEDEIYNMNEKVCQAHWSVRDAEINSKAIPEGIDPGVVMERHYGINWLMGYCGQSWDEVTTDT